MGKGGLPMPMADYSGEALDVRTKLVMEYGEDTVIWSEIATIIQLFFSMGVVRPTEFIDLVTKQCRRVDDRRRRAAGYRD